jgi:hypothetical protein
MGSISCWKKGEKEMEESRGKTKKRLRTLSEAFPNDKIGAFAQASEGGTLYIPKDLEEVGRIATEDAKRLMKRFPGSEKK